jgi:hypothetical protein
LNDEPDIAPEMPLAFDEQGRAFEDFAAVIEPPAPDDDRAAVREVIGEFLRILTDDDLDPTAIGKRLLLLASLFGVGRAGQLTGDELAELFGVKKARLSQLKSETAKQFPGFKTLLIKGKTAQCRAATKLQD